jgi:hypothetical protein
LYSLPSIRFMKWGDVRGSGNIAQSRDQKWRHFDHKPKWMWLFEFIFKTFLHELCCEYIRLWEIHVSGKTKNNFDWYGHVTVSLASTWLIKWVMSLLLT